MREISVSRRPPRVAVLSVPTRTEVDMLLRRFDVLLADDLHQALVIGLCGLFGGLFLGDHGFGGRLDIRGDLRVVGSCRAEVSVLNKISKELK